MAQVFYETYICPRCTKEIIIERMTERDAKITIAAYKKLDLLCDDCLDDDPVAQQLPRLVIERGTRVLRMSASILARAMGYWALLHLKPHIAEAFVAMLKSYTDNLFPAQFMLKVRALLIFLVEEYELEQSPLQSLEQRVGQALLGVDFRSTRFSQGDDRDFITILRVLVAVTTADVIHNAIHDVADPSLQLIMPIAGAIEDKNAADIKRIKTLSACGNATGMLYFYGHITDVIFWKEFQAEGISRLAMFYAAAMKRTERLHALIEYAGYKARQVEFDDAIAIRK